MTLPPPVWSWRPAPTGLSIAAAYLAISTIAADADFRARCAACAATQEGVADPVQWVNANALSIAASPGFGAAWDSAVAGDVTRPGADPSVISDGMILAATQAVLAG